LNLETDSFNRNNAFKSKNKLDDKEMINEKSYLSNANNMKPTSASAKDMMETCIIKNLISSYYHVVKKNINDLVPKTIMCFLVNQSKMMAEKEMVSQLYKSNELDSLLQEDPFVGKKRKVLKESLNYLKTSLDIIRNFRDLSLD
jgi:hypothetical protein